VEFIVVSEQLTYILYSFIFGFVASFVYFGIKILRMTVGLGPSKTSEVRLFRFVDRIKIPSVHCTNTALQIIFIHLLDVVYLIICSISFCIFTFYFNHGRIRWYLLFAALIGFWAFYYSVGKLILFISKYLVYIIKSFTKVILYGIIKIISFILRPAKLFLSVVKLRLIHYRESKRLYKHIFVKGESNGT
jgi:hypothetical protein